MAGLAVDFAFSGVAEAQHALEVIIVTVRMILRSMLHMLRVITRIPSRFRAPYPVGYPVSVSPCLVTGWHSSGWDALHTCGSLSAYFLSSVLPTQLLPVNPILIAPHLADHAKTLILSRFSRHWDLACRYETPGPTTHNRCVGGIVCCMA